MKTLLTFITCMVLSGSLLKPAIASYQEKVTDYRQSNGNTNYIVVINK